MNPMHVSLIVCTIVGYAQVHFCPPNWLPQHLECKRWTCFGGSITYWLIHTILMCLFEQVLYSLTSNYPSISASILQCTVLSFQPSGAIKVFFTIDLHANSSLSPQILRQAVLNEIRQENGDYNIHNSEGGGMISIDQLFLDFEELTCDPSPCLNDATCRLNHNFGFLCLCGDGFMGSKCQFSAPLTTEKVVTEAKELEYGI